jgi:hypothetical protein
MVYVDCLGDRDGMVARVVRLVAKQDVSEILAQSGFEAASSVGVDPGFSEMLDEVLERYKTNSMDILKVLSAHSIERLRIAALRTFAGAFRIRRPRDG